MTKWSQIYQNEIASEGGPKKFLQKKSKEKRFFLEKIIKEVGNGQNQKIIEAGCGTAVVSIVLSSLGYKVTAVDIDQEMLAIAKMLARNRNQLLNFEIADIKSLPYQDNTFAIAFNHGVLEHFSDQDIIKILGELLRVAEIVIFSVPSDYFTEEEKMYGNERFLNKKQWLKIIKQVPRLRSVRYFGYYFTSYFKYLLHKYLHLFKAPYIGFILKK